MDEIKKTIEKYSSINLKKFIHGYVKDKNSLFGLISFFVCFIIIGIIYKNISLEHGAALISIPFVSLLFGGLFFGVRLIISRLINPLIIGFFQLIIDLLMLIQYFFASLSDIIEKNIGD
jgi:hypothetical protein